MGCSARVAQKRKNNYQTTENTEKEKSGLQLFLSIRYGTVPLRPPNSRRKKRKATNQRILAEEENPPPGGRASSVAITNKFRSKQLKAKRKNS